LPTKNYQITFEGKMDMKPYQLIAIVAAILRSGAESDVSNDEAVKQAQQIIDRAKAVTQTTGW